MQLEKGQGGQTGRPAKPYFVSYSYSDESGLPIKGTETLDAASVADAMDRVRARLTDHELRFHVVRSEEPRAKPRRRVGEYVVMALMFLMALQLLAGQLQL